MAEYVRNGSVFVAYEHAPTGSEVVRQYKDLQRVSKSWDGKTILDVYNNLASAQGQNPVKKFSNRETGMKRLWGLLEQLPVTAVASRGKKGLVLDLVQRPVGATLDEIMDATGWQAHSVRGFLSVQRREYNIERRERSGDVIAYYANKK